MAGVFTAAAGGADLAGRNVAPACLCFLFLLFGQNGLHHVAGLGDVGKIDFRRNCLGCARRRAARVARRARSMLELPANLVGLVVLDRTRVGLALTQAEFPEHVKNLSALDFHLAREIVNSNLAHPPLFRMCYPKPLVAHSYLMALAVALPPLSLVPNSQRLLFVNGWSMVLKSATHIMRRPLRSTRLVFGSFVRHPEHCRSASSSAVTPPSSAASSSTSCEFSISASAVPAAASGVSISDSPSETTSVSAAAVNAAGSSLPSASGAPATPSRPRQPALLRLLQSAQSSGEPRR